VNIAKRTFVSVISAALLAVGLLVLLSLASPTPTVGADPGDLFVTVTGSSKLCLQSSPCSLQRALSQAVADDNIYVAAGTYTYAGTEVVSITKSLDLYGGWDGSTTLPVVRDPETYNTTIDGESVRRVVWMDSGLDVTIDGLTITNGAGVSEGAGIYCYGSDLTVSDTVVFSNSVYVSGSNSYGGGVYFEDGTFAMDSCVLRQNAAVWAASSLGGGLYATGDIDVTIEDSLFDANNAWFGSGAHMSGDSSEHLTVRGTTFKDNGQVVSPSSSGPGGYGGGMDLYRVDALIEDSSFLSGLAANAGGAIRFRSGKLIMTRTTVQDNIASYGTAIRIFNPSQFTLTNNIIVDNEPGTARAAAVEVGTVGSGSVTGLIAHNTLARNTKNMNGIGILAGLLPPGAPTSVMVNVINNIVVSHTVGISTEVGATVVATNTLWGAGDWANGADWGGSGSLTRSGDLWGDPSFVDPDGGDYHIRGDSAAFDQGVDVGVMDDLDGEARPWIGSHAKAPDIGADEFWLIPTEDVSLPLVAKKH
jgi:hypothetical protein